MTGPRIAVLGSANIDLVCRVPRLPKPGETVRASSVSRYLGGKGANQAVAAARLGAEVRFFGRVGEDSFGEMLLAGFQENGVDASAVTRCASRPSGTATIWVADGGENSIVIAEGANGQVDPAYVDRNIDALADADVLLLQLEIPLETVAHMLRRLPQGKPKVVLDPAPASPMDSLRMSRIDCLTPNEEELIALSGESDCASGTQVLLGMGAGMVACTLGEKGAVLSREGRPSLEVPAFPVVSKDSTAAGDAFAAGLAVYLAQSGEIDLLEAVRFACAAGALAATQPGAWPSLPSREDVLRLLNA